MLSRIMLATSSFGFLVTLNMVTYAQQPPALSDANYERQALAAGPEVIANGAAVVRPEHGNANP